MKSRKRLGTGPVEAHPGQTVSHVEAGSVGRLIRALMNVARNHPEWEAVGPVQTYENDGSTVFKQRIEKRG